MINYLLSILWLSKILVSLADDSLAVEQQKNRLLSGWAYNGIDNGVQAYAQWTGIIMDYCVQNYRNGEIGSLKYKCTTKDIYHVSSLTVEYYNNADCSDFPAAVVEKDFHNSKNNATCIDIDMNDKSLFGHAVIRAYNKQITDGKDDSCVKDVLNWEEFPMIIHGCVWSYQWHWMETVCDNTIWLFQYYGDQASACPRFNEQGYRAYSEGAALYSSEGCSNDFGNFPYEVVECVQQEVSTNGCYNMKVFVLSMMVTLLSMYL